jgi:AmmeMemoRadiSam system protein B/AmmeMemoRadiSam system protein A
LVQSIIVPHAGFDYCGSVLAAGYQQIPENAPYKNIFIITTSHRQPFEGVSVDMSASYLTPLGLLTVNQEISRKLISKYPQIIYHGPAHAREQGVEVHLPFIQHHLGEWPHIVPLVMGTSSVTGARDLATALLPWFTPENLFIISADFSRYPSYGDAKRIDRITADAVVSGDPEQFYNALRKSSQQEIKQLSTPSGDWSAIMTLLYMTHRQEEVILSPLYYQNSGDSPLGDHQRVVGYWAISGEMKGPSSAPPALTEEEKTLLLEISRSTLDSFIQNETIPTLPKNQLSTTLRKPASVMVSLYMGERLRGRLEYLSPAIALGATVQEMTIASATLDKRFSPVDASELKYIRIEISVLSPLHKISTIEEIDPELHGIYLVKDEHSGSYLPGRAIEENWSIEELLGHCAREKADLAWEDWKDAEIYIFEAISFSEDSVKIQ